MPIKNVFILGAGASVEAGAPIMRDFFDKTEDLLFSKQISIESDRESILSVFELIKKSLSSYANSNIDLNNIETIFGLLEMALIVKELYEYNEEQIIKLRSDLITLIVRTLEQTTRIKTDSTGFSTSASYHTLCEIIKSDGFDKNTVISFNYDMAFEAAFSAIGQKGYLDYGFDYIKTNPVVEHPLGYYKLHGSINWFENYDNSSLGVIDITKISRFTVFNNHVENHIKMRGKDVLSISELRSAISENPFFSFLNDCSPTPFIIPPSWNKSAYHHAVGHIWQKAVKAITEASNIYIIGYSLPQSDLFFKYLFTLGTLQNSRIRSLKVYDPNPNIEQNYRDMLGKGIQSRFSFHPQTFSAAIADIKKDIVPKHPTKLSVW